MSEKRSGASFVEDELSRIPPYPLLILLNLDGTIWFLGSLSLFPLTIKATTAL